MYSLVFDSQKINQQLYTSIEKLISNYTIEKTSKLLGLTQNQLNWLTQFSDTENFTNLQELHNLFYDNSWKKVIEIDMGIETEIEVEIEIEKGEGRSKRKKRRIER